MTEPAEHADETPPETGADGLPPHDPEVAEEYAESVGIDPSPEEIRHYQELIGVTPPGDEADGTEAP